MPSRYWDVAVEGTEEKITCDVLASAALAKVLVEGKLLEFVANPDAQPSNPEERAMYLRGMHDLAGAFSYLYTKDD